MSVALTANRLTDGRVVYHAADGAWAEEIAEAATFADEAAALAAPHDAAPVVGVYAIAVEAGAPTGQKRLRESIRRNGPTAGSTRRLAEAR